MALAQNKTMTWQSWTSKYNEQEVDKSENLYKFEENIQKWQWY